MRDSTGMNTTIGIANQTKSGSPGTWRISRAGFTLVEMLVVLAIIAILATAVGLSRGGLLAGAKRKTAISDIKVLKTALEVYDTDHGGYPTLQQGLSALVSKPSIPPVPANYPSGGYLDKKKQPTDPWGSEYIYLVPGRLGEPFEIMSYGKDKRPGGEGDNADISSSEI